jgi:cytochrome P450
MDQNGSSSPISDEWIEHHFDHLSPDLARELHPVLARARQRCPVARSDAYDGGFWVATTYGDVLNVAQEWETFSSELGITVPQIPQRSTFKVLPVGIDPPLHREFKRLINAYFTPSAVLPWERATRQLVNRLIDTFIEKGQCDFMAEFARPFPGLAFFELALHAPAEDLEEVNYYASMASRTNLPESRQCLTKLAQWIGRFVERRAGQGRRDDVVDAIMNAQIEGRPITAEEVVGTVQLLVLGGLDTTAGVLGSAMLRFCQYPEIPALLRARPALIPNAVEELLRLDGSFICVARTARHQTQVDGNHVAEGEQVLIYWASANRDESEFEHSDVFDLDRPRNRHIAFGAGPHRCAGSNLARMNLRVALVEVLSRLRDIRLQPGAEIEYSSGFNLAPQAVPIMFTPARIG